MEQYVYKPGDYDIQDIRLDTNPYFPLTYEISPYPDNYSPMFLVYHFCPNCNVESLGCDWIDFNVGNTLLHRCPCCFHIIIFEGGVSHV